MWPMLLDYSDDECKKILRKLELEAYASIISAFRAQGELTKEKKKMLQELSTVLSISLERHRAEIRRAVNDEHLNTIADRLAGPNTTTDWAIEGRRVIPLMPRPAPQNAFTAMANCAADAQAAKNATLPVPSATGSKDGYHIENEENMDRHPDPSRKRASSPLPNVIPEKYVVVEHSPISSSTCMEHEESNDLAAHSNSSIAQCVLQPVLGKDAGLLKNNVAPSKPLVSAPNSPSTKVNAIAEPNLPLLASKSTSNSFSKSVSMPSSVPPSIVQVTKPSVSVSSSSAESTLGCTQTTSSQSCSIPNSISSPLFSTACGLSQSSNAITTSIATTTLIPKTQSKVLLTKPLMRPRLFSGNMLNSSSQSVNYQSSNPQLPTPNLVHKVVSPLKPRPPAKNPSPVISSSTVHHPTTTNGQTVPRVQSPVSAISRVTLSATTISQTPSSLPSKPCQSTVSLTTSTKSNMTPRVLSKPALRPPMGPRTVLASVAKAPTMKSPCAAVSSASTRQPVPISVVKTSVPLQLLSTAKSSSSLTYSTKVLLSPSQAKSPAQPVAKTIHYRNDGGLKIISQNLQANRILPKPAHASQPSTTNPTRVVTTTTIGTARIVNFSQPYNTRFARALPSSSSIAAVNLVNSLPVSGLRVTMPVNNSMMRAALPAKPNVIVVHKAQVWPQSPGATIVMTSTGSLSRLSNEAIKNRLHKSSDGSVPLNVVSENFTSFPKIDADSLVITKQSVAAVVSAACTTNKSAENPVKKDESSLSSNAVSIDNIQVTSTAATVNDSKSLKVNVNYTPSKDEVTSVPKEDSAKDKNEVIVPSPGDSLTADVASKPTPPEDKMKKDDTKEEVHSSTSSVSIRSLNLDNLQEGQILELQPQDAAELLSQHGPLSTDVIELLQQAGLQMEVADQDTSTTNSSASNGSKLLDSSLEASSNKSEKQNHINPSDSVTAKSVAAENPRVGTEESSFSHVNETNKSQRHLTCEEKCNLVDTFLKGDSESRCNDDLFLTPVEIPDAEASCEVSVNSEKNNLASLQATESLGDSPTSQSLLNSFVISNVTVDMESVESRTLHVPLSPNNGVS